MDDILHSFSLPVAEWFRMAFGRPTPPQSGAWPAIKRGEHTLLLAPTGSGKTLAAFLSALDDLFRNPTRPDGGEPAGIRVLYVSPLKALNNDIERNLRVPLAGIRASAERLGVTLPEVSVRVRSGDTPDRERRSMLKQPPEILITTPESLYLMLTAPRARELFRSVRTLILDEIHTLAGTKRGVHLALSLERLERLSDQPVQRIGLSATIRPLDEVAHFLGGATWSDGDLVPRPVTVIDAGNTKPLDLRVETLLEDDGRPPGGSLWPAVVRRVADLIEEHRTTLVFANSRRVAERTADWLNEEMAARAAGRPSPLLERGTPVGVGFMGLPREPGDDGQPPPIRAHHGSMAKEARLEMERDLKAGRLPALVGTSSLELGIDIGSVDLVVQLQSPKAVAQGLQRVGRSGHLVGQTSKGRILPLFREDVMESAVIARGMLQGEVESTRTPHNALDVLAQQLVAMVAAEDWEVEPLFALVRQAYPYRDLTARAFRAVLEMLAGRYPSQIHAQLRPRLLWDRTHDRLAALPGARLSAVTNGGTIPDRGAFGTYLPDGKTRIGELDEEFVFETRVGDTFLLGSQVWRVLEITEDRVTVTDAPGAAPRMPFWHGDYPWRPYELGRRVGEFRREMAERLDALREEMGLERHGQLLERWEEPPVRAEVERLRTEYALDERSARQVVDYVAAQLDGAGVISSDSTVLVERVDDPLGEPRLVVHSPFGGRVNGPWGLALAGALEELTHTEVEVLSNDEGILLRFPASDAAFPADLVATLGPDEARDRLLRGLPDSALFGAQFRQNAARALLLPGARPGRRSPFWLQRLRAKDLLQAVRRFEDFPLLVETYRDCLEDVMDLPHLETVLRGIEQGEIQVVMRDSVVPSPVAQGLLMAFSGHYLYEWDTPKVERRPRELPVDPALLQDLLRDVDLGELLRPQALREVQERLQRTAPRSRARTADELQVVLQELGDLSTDELRERTATDPGPWLEQLADEGRALLYPIPGVDPATGEDRTAERWIPAEYLPEYAVAFGAAHAHRTGAGRPAELGPEAAADRDEARRLLLHRLLRHAGPLTRDAIRGRYAFPAAWLDVELERLVGERRLAKGRFSQATDDGGAHPTAAAAGEAAGAAGPRAAASPAKPPEYVQPEYLHVGVLERAHRRSLGILRGEVRPVPLTAYADFLAHWQHLGPSDRLSGEGGLRQVLEQLRGTPVLAPLWERDLLPLRLDGYDPAALDDLFRGGELVWVASGGVDPRRARLQLFFRGEGALFVTPSTETPALGAGAATLYELLQQEGALFFADIVGALGMTAPDAEAALTELVLVGLVTNDGFDAVRHLLRSGPVQSAFDLAGRSSLETQLAERRRLRGGHVRPGHRPARNVYRAASLRAHRAVDRRLTLEGMGRWTLVSGVRVMGRPLSAEDRAVRLGRQLLARYGVVSREHAEREERASDWPLLYRQLERMEFRGEVRRGYFVQGLPGVQFASADALERLQEAGGALHAERDDDNLVLLGAADPANLFTAGSVAHDQELLTVPRLASSWLVLHRGLPLLAADDRAARLRAASHADELLLRAALRLLIDHLARFRAPVSVARWNGEPVLDSAGRDLLLSLGERYTRLLSLSSPLDDETGG